MLRNCGLDPSKFALHSPRIGGASEAFATGVPDHLIDTQGRWKSPASKFTYLRVTADRQAAAFAAASQF